MFKFSDKNIKAICHIRSKIITKNLKEESRLFAFSVDLDHEFEENLIQRNSTLFTSGYHFPLVQQILSRDNLRTHNPKLEGSNRNVRMISHKNVQLSLFWSEISSMMSHWCF